MNVLRSFRAGAHACCALLLFAPSVFGHLASAAETTRTSAAELVTTALQTELSGPSALRRQLLEQALHVDPDNSAARWQSGFVRWGGTWLTPEDAAREASQDKRLAAYHKHRSQVIDTAEGQRELARLCRKMKLVDEERVHWAKVLEFDGSDAEAIAALGMQLHNGRLLTRQQLEAEKERARLTKQWLPQLAKWRDAIETGSEKQRSDAIVALGKLDDPAWAPAVIAVFHSRDVPATLTPRLQALIDTLAHLQAEEATQTLLQLAMIPKSVEIRSAAAAALRSRPWQAFVPVLLATLTTPGEVEVETSFVVAGISKLATYVHEVRVRDGKRDYCFTVQATYGSRNRNDMPEVAAQRAVQAEARLRHSLATYLETTAATQANTNNRALFVLHTATDVDQGTDPKSWVRWWNDYLDSYTPQYYSTQPQQVIRAYYHSYHQLSCFPRGTPVATLTGLRPIEEIQAGDRVLSQNPQTGELAYKSVQALTLRPPAPLIEIGAGSTSLRVTRGHPFWVNGQGWRMTKQLEVGQSLHGLQGAITIDRLEERPPAEAYNLVVSDFDTYFAGDQRVLVHDNLPIEATAALVPGLLDSASSP